MSDTPRTDNRLTAILDSDGFVHNGNCPQRWVNHARELERELNAANERIKRMEEAVQRVEDLAHSVQDWSGTALGDALDELNKAKETKP